jgi:hypothetical protein
MKRVVLSTLIAFALAIPVSSSPAAAADGRVAFVQGSPGPYRVDLCIDGQEARSGLPYARSFRTSLGAGDHRIKVFRRDPRTCRGELLFRETLTVQSDGDLTVVLRRSGLLTFSNGGIAVSGEFVVRHAARKFGPLDVYLWRAIAPTAAEPFFEGLPYGGEAHASLPAGTYRPELVGSDVGSADIGVPDVCDCLILVGEVDSGHPTSSSSSSSGGDHSAGRR